MEAVSELGGIHMCVPHVQDTHTSHHLIIKTARGWAGSAHTLLTVQKSNGSIKLYLYIGGSLSIDFSKK